MSTKKITNYFKIIIAFALSFLIFSCAQESPDLLNPPPQFKTVRCRFVNLAGDKNDRVCVLDRKVQSLPVKYAASSKVFMPPSDSSIVAIQLNGVSEYSNLERTKFQPSTYFTLIGVPSYPGRPVSRPLDTVLVLSTTPDLGKNTNYAYLTIFNAFPDTSRYYNVNLGCPNGQNIGLGLNYRGLTIPNQINAGQIAVSLSLSQNSVTNLLGLFKLDLKPMGQYALIIYQKPDNTEGVLFLDEFDTTATALTPAEIVLDRSSDVRTINFSRSPVTIQRIPDETVATNISSNYISGYSPVGACNSGYQDSLAVYTGNYLKCYATTSLEVLNKFTVLVFDSANSYANKAVIAPPIHLTESLNGRSIVRVVHGAYNLPGLEVSLGARDNTTDSSGYSSGDSLTNNVKFGNISNYQLISPGIVPITIFTSAHPKRLLYNSIVTFEGGKEYLLVVTNNPNSTDGIGITLIEDDQVNSSISLASQGGFFQVVDLIPDLVNIAIKIPPVLTNAKLYYSGSLASVLPEGNNNLNIAGKSINLNVDKNYRYLIIATGTSQNPDILTLQYSPIPIEEINYKRRFINASTDINSVSVAVDCDTCFTNGVRYILYGASSYIQVLDLDRKYAYFFVDDATSKVLLGVNDVYLPMGTVSTIIFGGNATSGYNAVIQQEY